MLDIFDRIRQSVEAAGDSDGVFIDCCNLRIK